MHTQMLMNMTAQKNVYCIGLGAMGWELLPMFAKEGFLRTCV